jgi:hypothetical protein
MAQGNHKLGKPKKSSGSQKRSLVKAVTKKAKGGNKLENDQCTVSISKAINKKNERLTAAKAQVAGSNFFLNDISKKGGLQQSHFLATIGFCVCTFVV